MAATDAFRSLATARARRRNRAALARLDAIAAFYDDLARELRGGAHPSVAVRVALVRSDRETQRACSPLTHVLSRGGRLHEGLAALAAAMTSRRGAGDAALAQLCALGIAANDRGALGPRGVDALARSVREQAAARRVVRAAASQAMLSARVLGLAPLLFAFLLVRTQATAGAFLLTHPLGRIAGVAGLTLDALGLLWLRAQVRRVLR
jgi:Flp pilus assembly protein TadB